MPTTPSTTFFYPASWTDTVVRQRPALVTDRYGNSVPDWANTTDLELAGVLVTSRATGGTSSNEETEQTRESDTTGWAVYARGVVDVNPTDRIVWNGLTFAVEGEPALWPSPHGDGIHNTQIDIVETVG